MFSPPQLQACYSTHLARLSASYARVLSSEGFDAVILHSGAAKSRTRFDDQYWPFRVVPHFQHWLPLAEPECALVIENGKKPKLLWLREQNFWERPGPAPGNHWQSGFEIVQLDGREKMIEHLPKGKVAFIGEEEAHAKSWGLVERFNPSHLVAALDQLRVTKSEYEILCIEEANRIASIGHAKIAETFGASDLSELDLHLLYLKVTEQDDPETPYKNIVAVGHNAATLHHISYERKPRGAQSLLLDAGAVCFGYTSDITRTYVKGKGEAASVFGGLIAAVENMQQRLCSEIKLGMPYEQLHERAHLRVGEILKDIGVSRVSAEENVAAGLTRSFFPHGLGHSLGLQCHDVGCALIRPQKDNPFLRNTTLIAPEQVFTVEPGVYFIEMLLEPLRASPAAASIDWALVDQLTPLGGVRIEDDIQITKDAPRNLTRAFLPH